jgi:hypothetical protein
MSCNTIWTGETMVNEMEQLLRALEDADSPPVATSLRHYRLYLLNDGDGITSGEDLLCDDDAAVLAVAEATRRAQRCSVEVWEGTRLVARIYEISSRAAGADSPICLA